MEDINSINLKRRKLEIHILELAENVPIDASDSELDWLYSPQLYSFIAAWLDLAGHYAESGDTVIGVEAISEYVNFVRIFRRLICKTELDPKHKRQAEDRMHDLDTGIDEIIKEAVTNLYS